MHAGEHHRFQTAPFWSWVHDPSRPVLIWIFVLVAILYYVAGRLALEILSERDGVAVFWPASGIAAGLATILTRPARIPIALAVAVATIVANLQARSSVPATMMFALCNAIECLIFVWAMERFDKERGQLESLGSFFAFICATGVAAGIVALPAALAVSFLGLSVSPVAAIWLTWFKSDGLGILVMAPAILTLPNVVRNKPGAATVAEGIAGIAAVVVLASFAFGLAPSGTIWPVLAPTTLLLPVFLWLAGRTPALFSALGVLLASGVIVTTALAGVGRLGDATVPLHARLWGAELAVLTTSLGVLTLAAMFARLNNVAAALLSSEERLKLSLAAGGIYAFDFDVQRGVVRRTGGLLDKVGLTEFGTTEEYRNSLDPADHASFERMLESFSPAERRTLRILLLRTPEGKALTVEHRAEAVYDQDGRLLNIRGICTDITAQEEARLALEKSAEQLRGALVAGRVFGFEYDAITHKATRSDNAAAILGMSLDEVRASRNLFVEHVHPDDQQALENYRKRLLPANSFTSDIFRFVRPDGGVVGLELTATGEHDSDGRLLRIRGLCHDVTDRMQADQERKRAEQEKSDLIEELNHRVKNALTTVGDVIELSREDHTDIEDFIATIEGRVGAMTRAHDRLTSAKWVGVGLAELVEDEIAAWRTPDNARVTGPVVVLPPKLAQTFALTVHELATNAAKHGALLPGNGRVEVSWYTEKVAGAEERLVFAWHEHTVKRVEAPTKVSYGTRAIREQLPHAFPATVDLDFTPGGLRCDISVRQPAADAVSNAPQGNDRHEINGRIPVEAPR